MPLLYYWRPDNYRRDLDMGAGYHLNQANPLMHAIDVADSLWAFTRARNGGYALAAEMVIRAKTCNPPGFRYGPYRLWGDLRFSRYFRVEGQPDITPVIRRLSCQAAAVVLGQSFQGRAAVRRLTAEDQHLLIQAARDLPIEPRARLMPEDRLEAVLIYGDQAAVDLIVTQEATGVAEERRAYLYAQAPTRNRDLVQDLQTMYAGRCQLCLWDPRSDYGHPLCEGHHLQWLSRGGDDVIENLVLLCPNHHSAVHRCDAPLDFADLAFDFRIRREALRLNQHLRQA